MTPLEEAAVGTLAIRYYALVSFTILFYDYFLTIRMEIERYWHFRPFKWRWGVILFFLVRYLGVYAHIPILAETFLADHDDAVCDALVFYHQIYAVVIQFLAGVLLIIRTYALYDRNKWVSRVTSAVAVIVTAVGCWGVLAKHDSAPAAPSIVGCNSSLSELQGGRLAIAWGGLLIFDTLIFSLTLYKAFAVERGGRRTLFDILFRDGAVYFGCMAIANLSNIITFVISKPLVKGISTTFTNVLATTLMSRLMLNIRDPKLLREQHADWSNSARPSTTLATSIPFISTIYPSAGDITTSSEATEPQHGSNDEVELTTIQIC